MAIMRYQIADYISETTKEEYKLMGTGFSKLDVNSFLLNEGYEVYSIENNKWIDFIYGESAFISKKWIFLTKSSSFEQKL